MAPHVSDIIIILTLNKWAFKTRKLKTFLSGQLTSAVLGQNSDSLDSYKYNNNDNDNDNKKEKTILTFAVRPCT